MPVVERAAAPRDSVQFEPAGTVLGPLATDGDALAKPASGPGAAAARGLHPQRFDQPVEGAGSGRPQGSAQVSVQPAVLRFVGGEPLGPQRVTAHAAGLEAGEPDRFQDRQQRVGVVALWPA